MLMMQPAISFKRITLKDAAKLLVLSRKTFFDAFAHLNAADDMEAYAAKAFQLQTLEDEIQNPDSSFYYAMFDGSIAGYLKLNYRFAQTEFKEPDALEIERIYVAGDYQGLHIGKRMLDFAAAQATEKSFRYLWLGVWEHNDKAVRFYERNGFKEFGSHVFILGTDPQTDLLMKKEL